jgi:hypothetical protein
MTELPKFGQQSYSNQQLNWIEYDPEEVYQRNVSESPSRKLLIANGWFDTPIEYAFNSEGFRSAEFDPTGIMVFGCNYTVGIGLPVENIYHTYVGNELQTPINNAGVINASNGLMYRLAQHYIPKIKPSMVILQQTHATRLEVLNQFDHSVVYDPADINDVLGRKVFANWWFSELNGQVDKQRNCMAIKGICCELNIPLIVIDLEDFRNPVNGFARNLSDPGPLSHQAVADKILSIIKNK